MDPKRPDDQLSEREIAARMDRGLRRLVSMPPMPHKESSQKKRRAARKGRVHTRLRLALRSPALGNKRTGETGAEIVSTTGYSSEPLPQLPFRTLTGSPLAFYWGGTSEGIAACCHKRTNLGPKPPTAARWLTTKSNQNCSSSPSNTSGWLPRTNASTKRKRHGEWQLATR